MPTREYLNIGYQSAVSGKKELWIQQAKVSANQKQNIRIVCDPTGSSC